MLNTQLCSFTLFSTVCEFFRLVKVMKNGIVFLIVFEQENVAQNETNILCDIA